MKKILVIGCPGSGKSFFSRELARELELPLIPLDAFYHHNKGDNTKQRSQWRQKVTELVSSESWIIDGNYKSSFDIRMPASDTIIFLDYPRWLVLLRALKRRIEYHRKKRPDMPEDWKEKLDWEFLQFIWSYRAAERPRVLQLLEEYATGRAIHILKSPREAKEFLQSVRPIVA